MCKGQGKITEATIAMMLAALPWRKDHRMKSALLQRLFSLKDAKMASTLSKRVYREYASALKELTEAQNKARKYYASYPPKPGDESLASSKEARKAFQRLSKAYVVYARKYLAWKDFLKAYDR
jgi:hypothetical protein